MTRIKRGVMTKKRHRRLLKETKGYCGQRKNVFRRASETHLRAMAFATKGRKLKKRDMRALFISRIKAAVEQYDMSYSTFINALKVAQIDLNRKMLSQLAIYDPQAFSAIVATVKQ